MLEICYGVDCGDWGSLRERRPLASLPTDLSLGRSSKASSLEIDGRCSCPKSKNPHSRSQGVFCLMVICDLLVGAERALTPQPPRPADLEGEGVRLSLFPRRGLRPSCDVPGKPSFRQLGHLGRPSRPRPGAKRHAPGSQSRRPGRGRRRRSSYRLRRNTSPGRSLCAVRPACAAAMKPCGCASR